MKRIIKFSLIVLALSFFCTKSTNMVEAKRDIKTTEEKTKDTLNDVKEVTDNKYVIKQVTNLGNDLNNCVADKLSLKQELTTYETKLKKCEVNEAKCNGASDAKFGMGLKTGAIGLLIIEIILFILWKFKDQLIPGLGQLGSVTSIIDKIFKK